MRITLAELELHRITAAETFAPGSLDFRDTEFRQAAPLVVNFTAELLGAEIRIKGRLTTQLDAHCDRCVGPVTIPVDRAFDLFYRPVKTIAKEEEIEIPDEEMEVGFYTGDGIELKDVVTEQVILAVPMKVVCRDDCQGLCPVCGVNRNVTSCDCAPPPSDSPFASLKEK